MLTRRALLKSAVATGVFAPFYREALAQTGKPMRLVLVLECNGIYPEAFLSSGTRVALGPRIGKRHNFRDVYPETPSVRASDGLSSALCLGPLAASSGAPSLENRAAVLLGLSSTITGGGHSTGTGALSCAVNGSAATLDAVLAPRLKRTAPFDAIRLGTSSASTPIVYETCAYGPRKPAGILVNPMLAYNTIFGSLSASTAVGQERRMLFDFAREDAKAALGTFKGNSHERTKLERYLASLEALRARETQLQGMAARVKPLLPPDPSVNPLLQGGTTPPDSLKWLEAQFEIATTALLGGLTNLVVLAAGTSGFDVAYDPSISQVGRHNLQHGIDTAANWNGIAAVTRKHVALVAKLARALAATPEFNASGSMLDHTVIILMSDNGEQHHSEAREWPKLVLGGNALGLKTDGRTVVYPAEGTARNRQVSNLFNTLGHAFGDTGFNTFGAEGPTRIAEGPLSELLG
ncbi:DUF1552 domain-containing protein [Cystobacter fuscus]|uniref:DUF1552 domain-containing protein n=1 Tax=Cystobacter fuscus TaxID=43 RepID=UPI002B30F9CD|nr:DUF1552 domain-containing protein [Cystobacter fuscus]